MSDTAKKSKKPKQKPTRVIKNNWAMLCKVAKLTPGYIVYMVLEGIIYGLINAAMTVFTYNLFNAMDAAEPSFSYVLTIVGALAVFNLVMYLYTNWYWHYMHSVCHHKLSYRMHRELFERAQAMDLASYDDPVFYNDFVFAMEQAQPRAIGIVEDIGKIINRLVASGTVFTVLFDIDPLLSVILLADSLILIFVRQYMNRVGFRHKEETMPLHRRKNYINRLYYLSDYAKELRISKVDGNLMGAYHESMGDIVKTDVRYGKAYYFKYNGLLLDLTQNATYFGVLIYMVFQLANGHILVGGLAAAINAIWQCRWLLNDLVTRFAKFPEHSLYVEKYLTFLSTEPTILSGELAVEPLEVLTLEDVSFAYPQSKRTKEETESAQADAETAKEDAPKFSLLHVSLTIKRGEKVAFVGYNGAGKTTLTKLLMRLYDPTEGRILYNGQDLRELKLTELRGHIGAVFQDYKLFGASLAENVLGDEYDGSPEQEAIVRAALTDATFDDKLEALTDGLSTILTREFDDKGVNLSGGESQKVAIARCFARPYELMILDEPSSALDPLAEYELNHAILQKADDRTVIFISHRLSTTRMADRIYMFENGSVIEEGSHEELMSLNGKYAEMFRLQAEKYRLKAEK